MADAHPVMSCEALAGDRVVDRSGVAFGTLAHIVVDLDTGRIAHAVVAHGGVFGIGATLAAVPWHWLTIDAQRRCFVLEVPRHRLDNAAVLPRFEAATPMQ